MCFPISRQKVTKNQNRLQNAIERTLPYYKLKVIFKSPSKIVSHFYFKDVVPKNSALVFLVVLSA